MGLFDRRKREEREAKAAENEPDELDTQEDPPDESEASYRAMYLNFVPAGDEVLLHDPDRAAPLLIPTFELDLLAHCTHFASVEEHAAAAATRTGLPANGVADRLYEMVDRGLMINKQEVVSRAIARVEAERSAAPPALNRIAVITANRPGSLDTCLRSYRELYGAEVELVVFDDSADAGTREENRRVAARAAGERPILYAGEDEKRQLITELAARSGIDPAVVRGAVAEFDGCALHCGSNRNSALLDAAGGAVLMVDDDTTARVAYPADAGDGLRVSSRYDPWSVHFFRGLDDALDAAEWREEDILAWHRRFLGRSPTAAAFGAGVPGATLQLDTNGGALDLDEADVALIAAFSRGRGRIVVTSAGVIGDSGMAPQTYFLSLHGAARDRLLENYELHRATRGVHRGAAVPTISNTHFFMSPHAAFDLRDTIPPFPPVLRNADGAFGAILRTCAPESYIAFLPWSVEHRPPEPRPGDFDQILRSIGSVRANDIMRDLANAYEPTPGVVDPAVRLAAFGDYMAALGSMPAGEFGALVRYQIIAMVGRRIERLTRVVDVEGGQPEQWAKDCATIAAEGLRGLTEDELIVADVPGATAEERNQRFQRALYRYGRLIEAWPTLLEAAADMRVARPLVS
jgi:hypothetical protein